MPDQLALFEERPLKPEGLDYTAAVITAGEEASLIERIAALPLKPFQFGQFEGKRRVVWFGYSYDYQQQRLVESEPIPGWLQPFIARVEESAGPGTRIEQILCTEYDAGVGIGWHRDKPHFDRIFGLSLGSACKFRFRRLNDKTSAKPWARFTLDAAPRSLYAMTGEAREVWEHSIPGVEQRRYSITFRTMRRRS